MIAFDLICSNGHVFECWFKDGASYEEQKETGILNCPICNDQDVEKVFSPFAIKKNGEPRKEKPAEKGTAQEKVNPYQALRMISEFIDRHFEDVGKDFAKEALKIHWGEVEKRNIRGVATPQEETLLEEEGVRFLKVPIVKRLDN